MADSANTATISFAGSPIGKVRDIGFSENSNEIDVTHFGDVVHAFESGIPNVELTVEVIGTSSGQPARGGTGAIVITWPDASTDTISSALCVDRETSGSLDSEVTTTYRFVPYGG